MRAIARSSSSNVTPSVLTRTRSQAQNRVVRFIRINRSSIGRWDGWFYSYQHIKERKNRFKILDIFLISLTNLPENDMEDKVFYLIIFRLLVSIQLCTSPCAWSEGWIGCWRGSRKWGRTRRWRRTRRWSRTGRRQVSRKWN